MRKTKLKGKCVLATIALLMLIGTLTVPACAKPEGELVLAVTTLGREIWTPHQGTMAEQYPGGMFYDKLLVRGHGNDMKFYPGLAESLTVSEDNLTYTFKLRKDVEFNEGWGPFTAEDVLYSMQVIGDKDSQNQYRHVVNDWFEKMEVVDPYTFRIKLKEPHPQLELMMSDYYPYMQIVCKKYFEEVGREKAAKHPIGTGPFILKEHQVGNKMVVEAVDNHWRHTPDFKTITIRIVPELGTRMSMLKAGDVDMINLATQFVDEIKAAGFKMLMNPGASYYILLFGGQVLPEREGYDETIPWAGRKDLERERKVRKALSLAVNKKEIIDYILKGKARQYGTMEFAPGSKMEKKEWTPYPYDPEQAKKLLAEAGYPNGFAKPIKMYQYTLPGRLELPDCGEAVAMYWEQLGLKVERVPMEWGSFRSAWYGRKKIHHWGATVLGVTAHPDPMYWYNVVCYSKAAGFHMAESLEMDKLIEAAVNEIDPDKRLEKSQILGQYVYDNYFACPIAMKDTIIAVSKKIKDYEMNSLCSYLHNLEYIHRAD